MNPMSQSDLKDWSFMLTMWAFFGTVLYIVGTSLRRKQQNAMQQHVLDKFASAKDFADFVQSPAGQKYVMSFADTASSSQSAILSSVRTGVVLDKDGGGVKVCAGGRSGISGGGGALAAARPGGAKSVGRAGGETVGAGRCGMESGASTGSRVRRRDSKAPRWSRRSFSAGSNRTFSSRAINRVCSFTPWEAGRC